MKWIVWLILGFFNDMNNWPKDVLLPIASNSEIIVGILKHVVGKAHSQ